MRALLLLASVVVAQDGVHTSRKDARVLPLPKEEGVFHFVIFGDRTGGRPEGIEVLKQAVKDTNLLGPDLVMTVGDLVNGYNETPAWLVQAAEYRGAMAKLDMPWYPVAGNHDVYWRGEGKAPPGHHEENYEAHFGPLWYAFQHKNAGFVVLYTDEGDRATNRKGWNAPELNRMSEEQRTWLRGALVKLKGADHVFAFMHHPRWLYDSDWNDVHAILKDAGNVTAVFAGHIHRQRYDGKRDGIEYFTLATVGGGMPMDVPGSGYLNHFNVVTVRKDRITVGTIPVGKVIDPREMTKERIREIDMLRGAPRLGSLVTVAESGSAEGRFRVTLKNPTTRPVEINAEMSSRDSKWRFKPDHVHRVLQPGTSAEVAFTYARGEGLERLREPRLELQYDYLASTMRVSLPRRSLPLGMRLAFDRNKAIVPAPNRVLELDGKNDCLAVPSAMLDLPDGAFTIEGWCNAKSFKGLRGFIAKTEGSEYCLAFDRGTPAFYVFLGNAYSIAKPKKLRLETDRWYHLAGVFDGAELRLYVDGKVVARAAGSGARRRNGFPLYVGADPNRRGQPHSLFQGRIDEVRISRGARYAAPFTPERRLASDDDTLLLLHCDRIHGPFALDVSDHGRHAIRRGGVNLVAPE